MRGTQHLAGGKVLAATANFYLHLGDRGFTRLRTPQELGGADDQQALADASVNHRRPVTFRLQQMRDQRNEKRCPGTVRRSSDAGCKATFIGKPFKRNADRSAIY